MQDIGLMVQYIKKKILGTTDAVGNELLPGLGLERGNRATEYWAPAGASEAEIKLGKQAKSFIDELR